MITKLNKGWRNVLMLCAAAVVAVLVSSCRAPASDAGRYQWNIVSQESDSAQIYVTDTVTGEIAEWNRREKTWDLSYKAPLSIPDWNVIRERRVWLEKLERKEREKREAFEKSFPQLPLEKQVAWAKTIDICMFMDKKNDPLPLGLNRGYPRLPPGLIGRGGIEHVENLKPGHGSLVKSSKLYKVTDDNLVVWFFGMVGGEYIRLGLSHTPIDDKAVFLAPATIIDDVKAEIKRQEEKKK